MGILDQYESANTAFRMGKVLTDGNEKLLEHLSGLSNLTNTNTGTQHRDIIRGITINHILLQRHIEALQTHISALDAKNTTLQKWVAALAFAALVAGAAQAITAILPYVGIYPTPPTASAPQTPVPQLSAPTLPVIPASGQPTKKSP